MIPFPLKLCPPWTWPMLYCFLVGNALIALSYFSIPIVLIRSRINIRRLMLLPLISAFIFSCGLTHVFKIVTLYHAWFWTATAIDLATGITSFTIAILLCTQAERIVEIPPSVVTQDVLDIRHRIEVLAAALKHDGHQPQLHG